MDDRARQKTETAAKQPCAMTMMKTLSRASAQKRCALHVLGRGVTFACRGRSAAQDQNPSAADRSFSADNLERDKARTAWAVTSVLAVVLCLGYPGRVSAGDKPSLATLLAPVAKGCRDVPLNGWRHPTRAILQSRKVELNGLQLCNGDRYPNYAVRFAVDAMGNNDDFFGPLYAGMAEANGFWPFAFVDLNAREIIWIRSKPGIREIQIEYDEYSDR